MNKAEKIHLIQTVLDEVNTMHAIDTYTDKCDTLYNAKALLRLYTFPTNANAIDLNINNAKAILQAVVIPNPDKVAFFVCQSLEMALSELLK